MTTKPTPLFRQDEEDATQPVSERIRSRLVKANQRYYANDNISGYLRDGEVEALKSEVESKMAEVLRSLVIRRAITTHSKLRDALPKCSSRKCSKAAIRPCRK